MFPIGKAIDREVLMGQTHQSLVLVGGLGFSARASAYIRPKFSLVGWKIRSLSSPDLGFSSASRGNLHKIQGLEHEIVFLGNMWVDSQLPISAAFISTLPSLCLSPPPTTTAGEESRPAAY